MKQKEDKNKRFSELIGSVLTETVEPPVGLLSRVMAAILWRQRLYAGLKTFASLTLSLGSLAIIFLAAQEVVLRINQSGILSILSLLFSDLAVVLANWQTFVLSCLESLPVFPIVLTVGATWVLLISLKFVFENTLKFKNNFYPKLRINY